MEGFYSLTSVVYHFVLWLGRTKVILGVPAELNCDLAISFGYPAEGPYPTRAGGRRLLDEVVRRERW